MDAQKVDMYLMSNAKYFEGHQVNAVREKLLALDDSRTLMLHTLNLKDPTTILIVSLLAGTFGIDRFMIGDTGLGIAKLITCGGLGIWTLVDWFMIQGRTKEVNFTRIISVF
ncbi:MAG: TM2 domain-containing protein [Cyclobacteriaceae bacterium]|jgi:TM2 domain-containing membrane protein YozV